MVEEALARARDLLSPQTVALMESAITKFRTARQPNSQRHSDEVYIQSEVLNFRWGHQDGVIPDEFVSEFKDTEVYSLGKQPLLGYCWRVKTLVRLSSVLCLSPQVNHEVNSTCIFNFQDRKFGATIHVPVGSNLDLACDFVSIPAELLDI